MPRGSSSSKRRASTESPPTSSSSSDDSELGSVKCDRSERVVTRSVTRSVSLSVSRPESRGKQTTATLNRIARGLRGAGCGGGGVGDVVEQGSNSRGGSSKREEKGKGKLGEDDQEKNERGVGGKVCENVKVIDETTLRTWEFASTLDRCFREQDKIKKLRDKVTLRLGDASSAGDDAKYESLLITLKGLQEKEDIFEQMLRRAAEEATKFSRIILNSPRMFCYLMEQELLLEDIHLYTPRNSPFVGALRQLANDYGFKLFLFTYC